MSSGTEYGNYDAPRDDWIRSFLTRILYLLVLVAAFILLICWFLPLVKERQRQQHALQDLKQQVEQEKANYNKQSKKLTLLQNDPA
jgi:sensor histidine kinase regulating citrate/malate metabolism